MANVPICPHCHATRFALSEQEPDGAAYKLIFVFCVGCGAPVGVTEYVNAGALIAEQEKRLGAVAHNLNDILTRVKRIEQTLRSRH